jgi:hypothetical protein
VALQDDALQGTPRIAYMAGNAPQGDAQTRGSLEFWEEPRPKMVVWLGRLRRVRLISIHGPGPPREPGAAFPASKPVAGAQHHELRVAQCPPSRLCGLGGQPKLVRCLASGRPTTGALSPPSRARGMEETSRVERQGVESCTEESPQAPCGA